MWPSFSLPPPMEWERCVTWLLCVPSRELILCSHSQLYGSCVTHWHLMVQCSACAGKRAEVNYLLAVTIFPCGTHQWQPPRRTRLYQQLAWKWSGLVGMYHRHIYISTRQNYCVPKDCHVYCIGFIVIVWKTSSVSLSDNKWLLISLQAVLGIGRVGIIEGVTFT